MTSNTPNMDLTRDKSITTEMANGHRMTYIPTDCFKDGYPPSFYLDRLRNDAGISVISSRTDDTRPTWRVQLHVPGGSMSVHIDLTDLRTLRNNMNLILAEMESSHEPQE